MIKHLLVTYLFERRWLDNVDIIADDSRRLCDVRQSFNLQVQGEGVGQTHGARIRTQDQVAHLNAVGRDNITENVGVIAQEFWEVM